MISPIFTTIVISFLCIMVYMKITTARFNTGDDKRLEEERQANSVRRKSLDELEYIDIPFDSLPFTQSGAENVDEETGGKDEILAKDEAAVLSLRDKKIVNFTGISNTDLKLTYGAPNLPLLSEYDQNYTHLVKSLDSWGNHLIERNLKAEARKVLEFAVECKTDLKSSYLPLADIYVENFEFDRLDHLIEVAGNINSLMKGPIKRALKEKGDITKYVEEKK
ncbi:MAG TPA: hypothetical protein DIS78_09295 [Lachnospiraceae bacterium]|nr:hypothetical protein [Lachnospiraceae bacterium]